MIYKKCRQAHFGGSHERQFGNAFLALSRILTLVLALAMVAGIGSIQAQAASMFSQGPQKETPETTVVVGTTLEIGRFEQDNNAANGAEPISWQVLAVQGDYALVLSEKALECIPFDTENNACSWWDSTLRSWLNKDFYETAFTNANDLGGVEIVSCSLSTNTALYGRTPLPAETTERIFVLSTEEAEHYLGKAARTCRASTYARKRGAYVNQSTGGSWWWLRTPGDRVDKVASVNSDGTIDYDGGSVKSDKGVVRPAMWICLGENNGDTVVNGFPIGADKLVMAYSEKNGDAPAEYRYNARGQLVRKIQRDWNMRTEYSYHDNGVRKSEVVYQDGTDAAFREYDDHGTIVADGYIDASGQRVFYAKYSNLYDSQNRLTKQTRQSDSLGDAVTVYDYEKDGSFSVDYTDYQKSGGKKYTHCHRIGDFTKDGTLTYMYREIDDLTRCDLQIPIEPIHAGAKYECSYDEAGRLNYEKWTHPDRGYGEYVVENRWEFDDQGNLLSYSGEYNMPDIEYFLQGKGEQTWYVEESYSYLPLSQVLAEN